jgi:hypothetical protein
MPNPVFESEKDFELGKILKKSRPNPVGEDVFLCTDGWSIEKDEDKIVAVQRIWKHEYYKPGGKGFLKSLEAFTTRGD